jgi:hypothetical protein
MLLRAQGVHRDGARVRRAQRAGRRGVRVREVMEIQATISSTPETPSKRPMGRGVVVAYALVALCYFSVAFGGY